MNNEKFLNQTGLSYYHDRAKTIFENKIEKVKVNGTEQTITNKEVDLAVAEIKITNTDSKKAVKLDNSDGTELEVTLNDNGLNIAGANSYNILFDKDLVDKNYVDANAGAINTIKVNGTAQTITNKEVDLDVPTMEFTQRSEEGETWTDSVKIKKGGSNSSYLEIKQNTENGNLLDIYTTDNTVDVPHTLTSKYYVDSKGSIEIDSSNNNKTTFTVGSKTSSLSTSPDGVIYTEGASDVTLVSKYYVDDAIAGVTGMEFVLIDTLPAEGEKGKIYLLSNQSAGSNIYDEYIWVQDGANGRFEKIGSTDVDLSNYYNTTNLVAITTAEIDALFA